MKYLEKLLIILFILIVIPGVVAKTGEMKLLAATYGEEEGAIASLKLDLKEGNGNVFFDTFPLTKIDTQISARFAKEIACDFLEINCDNYDFVYTISSDSSIIGGPSAGSAIAILTISLLKDIEIDESVAITGTINSGNIIGHVGGLKQKINAASRDGIKKVLIPKGERTITEDNETTDLVEYGQNLSIEVIEVGTLNDAFYEFSGIKLEEDDEELYISEDYILTMKYLSEILCNRSFFLQKKTLELSKEQGFVNASILTGENLTESARQAYNISKYYSAASYCFGANVRYTSAILYEQNRTKKELNLLLKDLHEKIENFTSKVEDRDIRTITDLESYMVVKERLRDSMSFYNEALKSINDTESFSYNYAYSLERLYSAYSWYTYFDHRGKAFLIDKELIKGSCKEKIAEAEERYQYFNIYFPDLMQSARDDIGFAYNDLNNGDYELCLFKASKAKAEIDAALGVLGVEKENVMDIINLKIDAARLSIIKQTKKGLFPILGYSYLEYSKMLKYTDHFSSLLYAEYALELGRLDMYFEEKPQIINLEIDYLDIGVFVSGILVGIALMMFFRKK